MEEIIFENSNNSPDIMEQFLSSDYFLHNELNIVRFLDEDNTIDLEKLELAVILAISYLENSVKIYEPIYINIGNMEEYIDKRKLDSIERITEESSFILGFCQAIADENKINQNVIVRFRGSDE